MVPWELLEPCNSAQVATALAGQIVKNGLDERIV